MSGSRANLLYVYAERIPENLRQLVLDSIPDDEFQVERMTYATPLGQQCQKMQWADCVLFAPGRHLADAVFENARHVRLMQLWSSGYDKFNIHGAAKFGIPVANNGGANAVSVAEHAVLLMLAVNKRLPDSHLRTVEGRWAGNSHGMDMHLLHEKTLGVIGFGNIGRRVAERAAGFGMKILYHDPVRAPAEMESRLGAQFSDLDFLLSNSDVVTLHLHLNDSTRHLIGRREFGLMKGSAILINVSRAQLVDNRELLHALESQVIRGAGMDVYDQEPTTANDPLLTHPSVVATPHMAGSTVDAYYSAMRNCISNLRRASRGEPLHWVVNGVTANTSESVHAKAGSSRQTQDTAPDFLRKAA